MQTAIRKNYNAARGIGFFPRAIFGVLCAAALSLALSACITAPPPKLTQALKVQEERTYGAELARQLERQIQLKSDREIDSYLNGLTRGLLESTHDSRLAGTQATLSQDETVAHDAARNAPVRWWTYALPGWKICLSLGLMKQLHHENEVAALISLELGNLIQSHALKHLKIVKGKIEQADFFGQRGLFKMSEEELKASVRAAVEILYKNGYDVRGLNEVWKVLQEHPNHAPQSAEILDEVIEFTRQAINRYPPLRNPVVNTEKFKSIQKRILEL